MKDKEELKQLDRQGANGKRKGNAKRGRGSKGTFKKREDFGNTKSNWTVDKVNADKAAAPGTYGNDLAWWNKVPELLENAATMKSNFIPGTDLMEGSPNTIGKFPIPGVTSVRYYHTYGAGGSPTSALNLAARDLFLKQFRKYRGISNYQATDMMMAVIAGVEVVSMVAHLERIYGAANYFQRRNQNVPYAILRALGISQVEAEFIQQHLSDYRYQLNLLIRKATKICVPKDMSILADRISLDGYLYLDHADANVAQVIAFCPISWGIFLEGSKTPLKTGSTIVFADVDNGAVSSSTPVFTRTPGAGSLYGNTYFPLLECMIDNLMSDSVQQIYGNLLTWFGEDQLITMLPFDDSFISAPVYSDSILHKFHNIEVRKEDYISEDLENADSRKVGTGLPTARLTDLVRNPGVYDVTIGNNSTQEIFKFYSLYQLDGVIYSRPLLFSDGRTSSSLADGSTGIAMGAYTGTDNDAVGVLDTMNQAPHLLDTYRENFDLETVTEGCLFKYHVRPYKSAGSEIAGVIYSCGFEIIDQIETFSVEKGNINKDHYASTYNYLDTMNDGYGFAMEGATTVSTLDWSPLVVTVPNAPTGRFKIIAGDLDHMRVISASELARIHEAILQSGVLSTLSVKD